LPTPVERFAAEIAVARSVVGVEFPSDSVLWDVFDFGLIRI
jgi:hypothetical protein